MHASLLFPIRLTQINDSSAYPELKQNSQERKKAARKTRRKNNKKIQSKLCTKNKFNFRFCFIKILNIYRALFLFAIVFSPYTLISISASSLPSYGTGSPPVSPLLLPCHWQVDGSMIYNRWAENQIQSEAFILSHLLKLTSCSSCSRKVCAPWCYCVYCVVIIPLLNENIISENMSPAFPYMQYLSVFGKVSFYLSEIMCSVLFRLLLNTYYVFWMAVGWAIFFSHNKKGK